MGIISKEEDIKKNNIKISQALPNKEYELSEDEIDEIKDNIREIMTRVYRSDVNKIKEKKILIIKLLGKVVKQVKLPTIKRQKIKYPKAKRNEIFKRNYYHFLFFRYKP